MATLSDLVTRVETRLSMVAGPNVQLYSENQIAEMIQHKFIMVRGELWWDDLMEYATLTLDANGRPNENVVRELPDVPVGDEIVINKYADIQHVWLENERDPMKAWPRRSNPTTHQVSGRPHYKLPDTSKVIRVMPFGEGQSIVLRYKMHFSTFLAGDTIPMDDQILILGACYDYLFDDGTNPMQAEKFLVDYTQRLDMLKSEENNEAISLSPVGHRSSSGYQVV